MSLEDYQKLKSFSDINKPFISNNLVNGVIDFYNWGVLNVGAFVNVTRTPPTSGVYGGDRFRLRCASDRRYATGQVWEGFRSNWVWETGIEYGVQPIKPSGVWVANTFCPTSGVKNPHYIDYPRGRVVFTSGLSTTSVVQTEFSPRTVYFVDAETPFMRKLMFDSWDVGRSDWLAISSGNWSEWPDVRYQLPLVGVEVVPTMSFEPFAIGGGQWCRQDVLFHVLTENIYDKRQITDMIASQNDKTIWIPNYGTMKSSVSYPLSLDYRGVPVISAVQYPELVGESSSYRWRKVQFTDTHVQNLDDVDNRLYRSIVRSTILIRMDNI